MKKITEDTERDHFLSAPEAQEYGLIDAVHTLREVPNDAPKGGGKTNKQPRS